MAKCVQVVGQGVPVRMSDADAFQVVVRNHDGQYCPKSRWRLHETKLVAKLVHGNITETRTLARHDQHAR